MTRRQLEAYLKLGAINANELDHVMRGHKSRERPPGFMKAIREVRAANAAAKRKKR